MLNALPRRPLKQRFLDNVTESLSGAITGRAMDADVIEEPDPYSKPVPQNFRADLLRNLVFHELCALLNSATIYHDYKRCVHKECVNILKICAQPLSIFQPTLD